jgi:hypothetical protein
MTRTDIPTVQSMVAKPVNSPKLVMIHSQLPISLLLVKMKITGLID